MLMTREILRVVVLIFQLLILNVPFVAARACVTCDLSVPTCNSSRRMCDSNCHYERVCNHNSDLCLASWWREDGVLRMFTSCFPLPSHTNVSTFPSECRPLVLNGTLTCLCAGETCNSHPRYIPGTLEEETAVVSSVATENTTFAAKYQYPQHLRIKVSKSKGHKLSILAIISIPVLITATACVLVAYRRKRAASSPNISATRDAEAVTRNIESCAFDLHSVLGCGAYSTVWRGRYKGRTVAIKTFAVSATSLWHNEKDVYLYNYMKHKNVLQFLSAEEKECYGERKLYLITDCCELGSLKGYLASRKLEWDEIILLVSGLAAGLAHLHSDWLPHGGQKCPIAHQDIKSTNVLVNSNRECVIADFGLAVPITPKQNQCSTFGGQVGTPRYMAPEKLEARIDLTSMEALKQIDVYAMALVIWEIVSQFIPPQETSGQIEVWAYQLPFQKDVDENPTIAEMIDLVLRRNMRPTLPESWNQSKGMTQLKGTMEECWDRDPEARLTAECVYQRTRELKEQVKFVSHSGVHLSNHEEQVKTVWQSCVYPSNCEEQVKTVSHCCVHPSNCQEQVRTVSHSCVNPSSCQEQVRTVSHSCVHPSNREEQVRTVSHSCVHPSNCPEQVKTVSHSCVHHSNSEEQVRTASHSCVHSSNSEEQVKTVEHSGVHPSNCEEQVKSVSHSCVHPSNREGQVRTVSHSCVHPSSSEEQVKTIWHSCMDPNSCKGQVVATRRTETCDSVN